MTQVAALCAGGRLPADTQIPMAMASTPSRISQVDLDLRMTDFLSSGLTALHRPGDRGGLSRSSLVEVRPR